MKGGNWFNTVGDILAHEPADQYIHGGLDDLQVSPKSFDIKVLPQLTRPLASQRHCANNQRIEYHIRFSPKNMSLHEGGAGLLEKSICDRLKLMIGCQAQKGKRIGLDEWFTSLHVICATEVAVNETGQINAFTGLEQLRCILAQMIEVTSLRIVNKLGTPCVKGFFEDYTIAAIALSGKPILDAITNQSTSYIIFLPALLLHLHPHPSPYPHQRHQPPPTRLSLYSCFVTLYIPGRTSLNLFTALVFQL